MDSSTGLDSTPRNPSGSLASGLGHPPHPLTRFRFWINKRIWRLSNFIIGPLFDLLEQLCLVFLVTTPTLSPYFRCMLFFPSNHYNHFKLLQLF